MSNHEIINVMNGAVGAVPHSSGTTAYTYPGSSWASIAMRPRSGQGYTAFSTGTRIFTAGLSTGPTAAHLDEYLPGSDSFTERSTPPSLAVGTAGGFMPMCAYDPNSDCAFFLGQVASFDVFLKYHVASDTWTSGLALPATPRYQAGFAAYNGKIYLIGGNIGGVGVVTVDRYDPATDTWSSVTPLPHAAFAIGASAAGDGQLWAITVNHLYRFDSGTNVWTDTGGGAGSSSPIILSGVLTTGDFIFADTTTGPTGWAVWRIELDIPSSQLYFLPDGFPPGDFGVCGVIGNTIYCWGLSEASKLALTPVPFTFGGPAPQGPVVTGESSVWVQDTSNVEKVTLPDQSEVTVPR